MKKINLFLSLFLFSAFSFVYAQNLSLNISGLEDLGANYNYEGWIIVSGAPVSTGTFTVDGSGNMSQTNFTVNSTDLQNATAFVLTIEPNPDSDPLPSSVHLLGGDFSGATASLSVGHTAALGNDFSGIAGNFILASPTNGVGADENSGIWFLDIGSGMPAVGLTLPTLPSGWKYEGWAVISGTPVSTGKFTRVDTSDESALYSGAMPGPPFPGEDFLMNAPSGLTFPTDLSGGTAVITIEPNPDNDAGPFLLKPLVGMIPDPATDRVTYPMSSNLASFPTGTADRSSVVPVELTSFSANIVGDAVTLKWSTATETNNSGFSIERSINKKDFKELDFIKGNGTSTQKNYYSYVDKSITNGKYFYRLKQIDLDGSFQYSNTIEVELNTPNKFSLSQNYPNPFNPSTKINFSLTEDSKVTLKLYNTLGEEVKTLLSSNLPAGIHKVELNASDLNSGVYFYKLEANGTNGSNFTATKKMILLK